MFKASFDKANLTSVSSSLEPGLELLAAVRRDAGVPVLTYVHEPAQVEAVAEVADVLPRSSAARPTSCWPGPRAAAR